jgi:tetratricopeptide (TPR) repeat protein
VPDSFAEYLQSYEESWLRLQQDTPQLVSYENRTLYTTWGISLDHVKRQSSLATRLLQLWAYFDSRDLWLQLLQAGRDNAPEWFCDLTRDRLVFNKAIRVLCDHALVEADTTFRGGGKESRGYSMHSCVHAWTRHVVNERWDDMLARLALRCIGLHVPHTSESQYWVTEQRLLRHADQIRGYAGSKLVGQDADMTTINAVHRLGDLYTDQSKLDEAEEMYKQALTRKEKALGPDHTSTLDTVNNLGVLYWKQRKLNTAEEMYKRALAGKEKALEPDNTSTLDTVNNLGVLYRRQGRLDKAEEMYERALEGYEKALGRNHTSTLDTVNNLGVLYWRQRKLDKAEEIYERALEGKERALGRDHTSTLETVNNLGLLYVDQGKLDKAEELYKRALEGYENALGRDHTSTLDIVNNLGLLYADQGKLDKAEEMYKQALEGREKVLGHDHTSTLNTVNNLGLLCADQGKLDKAEEMYERALQGYEKRFGSDYPHCHSLRGALATLRDRTTT